MHIITDFLTIQWRKDVSRTPVKTAECVMKAIRLVIIDVNVQGLTKERIAKVCVIFVDV